MRITNTREMIQVALSAPYPGDTSMAELLAYLTRIQHTQNTGLEKMVMDIQLAKIRGAINDQKAPIPAWLHYSYGPDLEVANKVAQKRLVGRMLAQKLYKLPIMAKKRDRLETLCACALEDYRMGIFRAQRLPIVVYCELMEVDGKNWTRDWESYRGKAMALIESLDAVGVGYVSGVVRQIREAEYA